MRNDRKYPPFQLKGGDLKEDDLKESSCSGTLRFVSLDYFIVYLVIRLFPFYPEE